MTRKLAQVMLASVLVLAFAQAAYAYTGAYTPGAGINSTVHDLSRTDTGMNYTAVPADSLNRICIYCHAPHNTYRLATAPGGVGPQAPSEYDYLPLWNHTLPVSTPAYFMYDNGTGGPQDGPRASQAIQNGMLPGSTSLLCLSCHDGSIAVNSYGNSSQPSISIGTTTMTTAYQIGKDGYLGNHHPIGFSYDDVQAGDDEIRNADTAQLTPTTTIREHLYGDARMECGTCHSVHNKGNAGERLLWRSDQNSELCLTCHAKGTYTSP